MNNPLFPAPLLTIIAGLVLLPGCAAPPDTTDAATKVYVDPASGVAFPEHVGAMDRVSLNTDHSDKNPVSAHYSAAQPFHTPSQGVGLMQPNLSFYLNGDIRVIPAAETTPEQLLGQTIRAFATNPNFAQEDYRGEQTFGNERAFCTQCSFDRPAWSDRTVFKIAIVPRGNYLVCFTFMVAPSQEKDWQAVIDGFIQTILNKSTKLGYMTPVTSGTDE
jgi:hypothetical protein